MNMNESDWRNRFKDVFNRGVQAWNDGKKTPQTMFSKDDEAFLASIGCTRQELFDFVDDLQRCGAPDFATALEVASIRRDYFLDVMGGKHTGFTATMESLPPKAEEVDGIAWLPRLIVKARLKLRGEMPSDLMYGCGGDRPFVKEMNMTLASFLMLVWECGSDDRKIVNEVKRSAGL